jgi:hypothetical protein
VSVPSIYMVGGHVLGGTGGIFAIAGSAPSFQLATNHFVQSFQVPVIVHPRPDSDPTFGNPATWERARLCPAGIPWRIPISMLYGAWPFLYEVTGGPAGLSIGQTFGSTDYGILSWANPVVGTYTVSVTITTQDFGRTAGSADPVGQYTVTWTLVVAAATDTRFVVVDSVNGSNANPGTFASPLQTLAGFSAATTTNKQVFFRQGTYAINALSSFLDLSSKARVWVGYPGETATIDYSGTWSGTSCYVFFSGGGASISNMTWFSSPSNWPTGSTNNDLYYINAFGDRTAVYENTFNGLDGHGATPANFGNWCAVGMFANGAMHNNTCIVNNLFENFTRLQSGGAVINYSTRWALWEGNTVQGFTAATNVQHALIAKGHCSQMGIRRNFIPSQAISSNCVYTPQGNDGGQGDDPNFNEVCWNFGTNPPLGNNGVSPGAQAYGSSSYTSWTGACYKNTIVGPNWYSAATGLPSTILSTNNILCTEHGIQNDAVHYSSQGPITITAGTVADVVDTYANRASVVDANGQLLSAYATAHGITLGTVGWVPL